MRELALHILDIAENGITAGADLISIAVREARSANRLEIVVRDNGCGMPVEKMAKIADPFVTSRRTRRVGLGLSLLDAAARRCGGTLTVKTQAGKGSEITATFRYDHIDRAPLGDMAATLMTLVAGNPGVDFVYDHDIVTDSFTLDTREIRKTLGAAALSDPKVICHLKDAIKDALGRLQAQS